VSRLLVPSLALLTVAALVVADDAKKPAAKQPPAPGFLSAKAAPSWIWLGEPKDKQAVFFRREVVLKGHIGSARLYATCDNQMTVYIDGQEVVSSNTWEEPVFKDVTNVFVSDRTPGGEGRHVVAVRARNKDSAAGFLLRLAFDSGWRDPFSVVSDESWKAAETAPRNFFELTFDDSAWKPATVVGRLGDQPWNAITDKTLAAAANLKEPTATPAESLKVLKGFKAELLYSVPKDKEGSWVNLCTDPKGRIIVSDQYGGLFRVTPPPLGGNAAATKVEKIPVPLGEAQGLLWAFDSLYVVVNRGQKFNSGLYRVRDTNGDDQLDEVKLLRKLDGGGEHGPHAVMLTPDGKDLTIVCGNGTKLTQFAGSRVPTVWGEDHLLPRVPDGNGFMRGVLGPGGAIYKVDPEGETWEVLSVGFRNEYDAAYNRHGELFSYDADMEWDHNTPWYRPTRICHVVSGSDWGWRNGAGKWPPHYTDTVPAAVDIGPGSPTGICFGYGAKFPAKYQDALFICDWSYGKLYAVHLRPDGASYKGEFEEFVTGTPLPLTDAVVNPVDGALYFAIGGRKTTSGLYRVTYTGGEPTAPVQPAADAGSELRTLRHRLEAFHGRRDAAAVETAWPYLGHADRFLRHAARVAIEHQDPAAWRDRALSERDPQAALNALLALVRVSAQDPFHRKKTDPQPDPDLKSRIAAALERIDFDGLTVPQQLDLFRVYGVLFNRMGKPDEATRQRLIARFDPRFPTRGRLLNAELCQLLVYLDSPTVAAKAVPMLTTAPTQEEQIEYAKSLRVLKAGWTPELRRAYFEWFLRAANYKGGASFGGFLKLIKDDAVATLTDAEKVALKPTLEARPKAAAVAAAKSRPVVRKWTLAELTSLADRGLKGRDFDRGRTLFGEAQCFSCHRFDNEGGSQGPDLTGAAGRFSVRDLLESVVEPNKTISDQYAAVVITTGSGKVVTGRIVNLAGDTIMVNTNMLDPNAMANVDRKQVESMDPSPVSMMPAELLDTLKEDEVLDLLAYLLSRGDRNAGMFKK
jgi:putative heme-binding domain-containing protein